MVMPLENGPHVTLQTRRRKFQKHNPSRSDRTRQTIENVVEWKFGGIATGFSSLPALATPIENHVRKNPMENSNHVARTGAEAKTTIHGVAVTVAVIRSAESGKVENV